MTISFRRKKAAFSLVSMSVMLMLAPFYLGSLGDRALDSYPKDSFILDAVDVQEYETRGNGKYAFNTSKYYELELYSKDKRRYFFRSPHPKKLFQTKYKLTPEKMVVVFHLEEIGKNGGQRIIELRQGEKSLISFENVVYEQNYLYWLMRLIAFVPLTIAFLIMWFPYKQGSPSESVS